MEYYMGSVMMFAFDWAPADFSVCAGQFMSISQNAAVYSLLGTRFGGNGRDTFALPDLRGRVPVGGGTTTGPGLSPWMVGEARGAEYTTLLQSQMPSHTHAAAGTATATAAINVTDGPGDKGAPRNRYLAAGMDANNVAVKSYTAAAPDATMASDAVTVSVDNVSVVIGQAGGFDPVYLTQPSLGIGYVICMRGLFPQRS